jgi:hypothetical protein
MENGQEFYWQNFYLGSIHTDISPIYVFPRSFINALSSAPVINATALVSLTLVSIALAISAFVVHATMGRLWAWGFLLLAWTDKWVMAASVASSLIAQPMTLTAAGLAFCVWALFRSGQSLRPRESWTAGCVVALGIIISFYSYSGVRFNWLCSVGLVGVILLARRALPLSLQGAAHAGRIIAPSIILLATLWLVLFRADSKAFSNQVFTSRDGWIFIESPVLQPAPVRPFNDVDVPMWWGSGIDTRINHVVYWKRTPRELFDRVVQYARQWSEVSNVEAYLVVLGVFALLVGLMSPIRERRLTLGLLGIFAIHSYLPIMIAQAPEAYRRGTFNAIALLLIITSLFASVPRAKFSRLISFIALAVFAVAKAPLELNPLLRTYMSIPLATNVCLACVGPGQLPLKRLVSSPTFQELRTQELFFLVNQSDMLLSQAGCMRIAMKSREMKELLPRGAEFEGTPGDLSASMKSLTSGQVLIVTCNSEFKTNEQIVRACQGLPPEGAAFLGEMPAEQLERYVWWVALKKL